MIYRVKCCNCGEIIELTKFDIQDEDEIEFECEDCGYPNLIGIEYDEDNNIEDVFNTDY
jgi:predicted nucleic-acid-binding Zn-ribbon protein